MRAVLSERVRSVLQQLRVGTWLRRPRESVHPTAVVDDGAFLAPGVTVGPFAVVGSRVRLGPGSRVLAHAVVLGETSIGASCTIGSHAVIGGPPQLRGAGGTDRSAAGTLVMGSNNCVREFVTVHAGSPGGRTRIGSGNLLMAYSHVAHDCSMGDS